MDPVRVLAEAIVDLGIADEFRLAPIIRATRERPISESTQDDTSDAEAFLDALAQANVIDTRQRDTLEKILRGEKTPRTSRMQGFDPFLEKIFGSFRAVAKIGEGGMGSVYRAERLDDLSRDYVIKLLSPLNADAASYVRFRREGEVMAVLRHPNVVRVFASGEEEGLLYIAMEFVDGPTLQDMFEQKKRFDWTNAAKAVRQVALGLDAAHSIGVIHRDVKPQNVLFSRKEGLLKVADFGLAKRHRDPSDPRVSRAGDILGSPAYIAPEQWGDHEIDPRADLWALGVVLYQLVTGVLPFRGRTAADYAKRILGAPFDPVELYAPDCPEGLRQVIARLLEKRREYRYPTAGQVVADLERVLRSELPDVPRLVQSPVGNGRWPLLGRDEFLVGRAAQAQIIVAHPSITERHALVVRTSAGTLLREVEGKGQVRVNGMRVREIALKDNDVIELAEAPPLRYRAGSARAVVTGPPASTPGATALTVVPPGGTLAPPVSVPGPVFDALAREEDARAVLALVELLDEATWQQSVERSKRRLAALGVDAETCSRATERARAGYRRLVASLPDRLFRATHENLGFDPAPWLGWWFTSGRERFPAQVLPPGSGARGTLLVLGEEGANLPPFDLESQEQWSIGRGEECSVRIQERSVSRKHATIHRLLSRLAIRDEGSRFGTIVRGERRPVVLLRHEDTIELGRVKLAFRQPLEDEDGTGIDRIFFDALVEMRSPFVQGALVALLDVESRLASLGNPLPGAGEEDVARSLRRYFEDRRRQALEALPAITKVNHGPQAAAWSAYWETARAAAPPQVTLDGS